MARAKGLNGPPDGLLASPSSHHPSFWWVPLDPSMHASGLAQPLLPLRDQDARWQGKDNKALEPHPLGCGIVVQEIAYAKLV